MKYLRSFILTCLFAFIAIHANATKADFTVDGFGYAITSAADLTVKVVSSPDREVISIPSTVVFNKRTFRITGIGEEAFQDHDHLISADMPWITYIESNELGAFWSCDHLKQVNMPKVTSIGERAFQNCRTLTSVNLPVATSIGYGAFQDCEALTSVSLPIATSIGDGAFLNCEALTSINLPVADSIGNNTFQNCKALTSVSLPTTTTIGYGAFQYCIALTSVSLPATESIEDGAFGGCDALTNVSLPALTSIGERAFYGCKLLADIYVGKEPAMYIDDEIEASNPPFENVTYVTATLHVPSGCASAYKSADFWSDFKFISEDYNPAPPTKDKYN